MQIEYEKQNICFSILLPHLLAFAPVKLCSNCLPSWSRVREMDTQSPILWILAPHLS